jgi:hypothetical protein
MDEDQEFYRLHLPQLVGYVVPVLQQKSRIELGSGVLVKVGERHFVATAKHCIDGNVRAVRAIDPTQLTGTAGTRELRVIDKGWHDTLDLGFLEIADPRCPELSWDQLCPDRIVEGMVQFIGYPEVLVERIETVPGRLTDVSLAPGTFGTTLREETEDRMVFEYPQVGMRYDDATGGWYESPFPATPRGFSGGACFGVAQPPGPVIQIQYRLLAIDYAWNEQERSVFAVPIKRWCELLIERGLGSG